MSKIVTYLKNATVLRWILFFPIILLIWNICRVTTEFIINSVFNFYFPINSIWELIGKLSFFGFLTIGLSSFFLLFINIFGASISILICPNYKVSKIVFIVVLIAAICSQLYYTLWVSGISYFYSIIANSLFLFGLVWFKEEE